MYTKGLQVYLSGVLGICTAFVIVGVVPVPRRVEYVTASLSNSASEPSVTRVLKLTFVKSRSLCDFIVIIDIKMQDMSDSEENYSLTAP